MSLVLACFGDLDLAPDRAPAAPPSGPACGDGLIAKDAEACDPGEAGEPGCTAGCAIECPPEPLGFLDRETNHCYFITGDNAPGTASPYEAALYACGFQGAHVVTFGSAVERERVRAWRQGVGNARFWVGLSLAAGLGGYRAAKDREPGWRPGCAGCFAAVPDAALGIPLAADVDAGGCVSDGPSSPTYLGEPCEAERVVICEREPPGSGIELTAGGFSITLSGEGAAKRPFFYVPVPVTADEAREGCAALGQRLAVFDSSSEREAVITEIQRVTRPGDESVWIGLASGAEGTFVWEDGVSESSRQAVWGFKEPAPVRPARAAALLPPLSIDVQLARALDPSERRPYLCQR